MYVNDERGRCTDMTTDVLLYMEKICTIWKIFSSYVKAVSTGV